MIAFIQIMFLPLAICLIFTGIHSYLGYHVIKRGVIFVDLALAQIALLGAGVALLLGYELGSTVSYWLTLSFAIVGAAVLSMTRFKNQRIPQEAIIGIVYVVSAALLVLILSHYGEGDEHIRHMLTGNILLVRQADVTKAIFLYTLIGIANFFLKDKFFLVSESPQSAYQRGWNVRWLDFLFYLTFGVVITSSVVIAGVFVVFAFLIIPPVAALFLAESTRARLLVGWVIGFVGSVMGISISYWLDYPTGASIVVTFGFLLAAIALFKKVLYTNGT